MLAQRCVVAFALLLVLGCGDDSSPTMPMTDASAPDAGAATGVAPAALPELGDCTTGTPEMRGGVMVCMPPPSTDACATYEARFLGDVACTPVKTDGCPAGDFAEDLPAGMVVYVRAGGSGDGTLASPYGTLAEAIAALPAGGTIALGKGTYRETNTIDGGPLTIIGACPSETVLTLQPAPAASVLRFESAGHELRNVSVGFSPPRSGLVLVDGGLRVQNVVVAQNGFTGIFMERSSLTGERLLIRDTQLGPGGGPGGRAINAADASTVDLSDVVVEQSLDIAVISTGAGTQVTLQRAAIRDTDVNTSGVLGVAALARMGATMTLRGAGLERNRSAAVSSLAGGDVVLEDVVIRDTTPNDIPEETLGLAVELGEGARATIRGMVSVNNVSGVRTLGGAVEMEDAVIDATVPSALTGFGAAFGNDATGSATLRRLSIAATPGAGMALGGPTTLEDLTIVGSFVSPEGNAGGGISIGRGNRVEARRLRIEANSTIGVLVTNAELIGEDFDIRDGREAVSGRGGRGIEVQEGGRLELTRAVLTSNREVSLYATGAGTTLSATELTIAETRERACAATDCADTPAGTGLGAYEGAAVDVGTFEISSARLCGVQLASAAQIDLRDGVVSTSAIGACVQVPGYDLERIVGSVEFRDNEINVQTDAQEVPEPTMPFSGF